MKKIIFLMSLCLLIASMSFAGSLALVLESTALSNGVTGHYFAETATLPATPQAYILQTGHNAGTRVFGSGSFATTISYSVVDDTTASILSGANFDSSEFDSGAVWTPLGN